MTEKIIICYSSMGTDKKIFISHPEYFKTIDDI